MQYAIREDIYTYMVNDLGLPALEQSLSSTLCKKWLRSLANACRGRWPHFTSTYDIPCTVLIYVKNIKSGPWSGVAVQHVPRHFRLDRSSNYRLWYNCSKQFGDGCACGIYLYESEQWIHHTRVPKLQIDHECCSALPERTKLEFRCQPLSVVFSVLQSFGLNRRFVFLMLFIVDQSNAMRSP